MIVATVIVVMFAALNGAVLVCFMLYKEGTFEQSTIESVKLFVKAVLKTVAFVIVLVVLVATTRN